MAKTTAVVARARTALSKNRAKLAAELATIDGYLAALNGLRPGARTRKVTTRRKSTASPRQLANLRKARRALKLKRAAAKANQR